MLLLLLLTVDYCGGFSDLFVFHVVWCMFPIWF